MAFASQNHPLRSQNKINWSVRLPVPSLVLDLQISFVFKGGQLWGDLGSHFWTVWTLLDLRPESISPYISFNLQFRRIDLLYLLFRHFWFATMSVRNSWTYLKLWFSFAPGWEVKWTLNVFKSWNLPPEKLFSGDWNCLMGIYARVLYLFYNLS